MLSSTVTRRSDHARGSLSGAEGLDAPGSAAPAPRLLIRGSQTGVCVYNLNLAHLLNEPPRVGITEEHVIPDSCRATWNPRQTQERFRRSVYAQSPCLLFDRLFE